MSGNEWSHTKKEWQETLDLARMYGWKSKPVSDHGGLRLSCPTGVHTIRVYSTADGTENVARSKRNTIKSCEHRNIADAVDRLELKLTDADRMLKAAEALAQKADAESRMQHAIEMLDEADQHLSEAESMFDAASASLGQANTAIEQAPEDDVSAGGDKLLRGAGSRVREVTLTLRDLPSKHERVQSLSAWCDELRGRVDALRARPASS